MKTLSIGKIRGLQQCSSTRGTISTLALDHRGNLRRSLNPQDPSAVTPEQLTKFKVDVATALAPEADSLLTDPEFGAAQAIVANALPAQVGLVVAVEASGYTGDPTARHSRILPEWSVAKVRRMGASMVKVLAYYHPEAPTAKEIEAFIRQVADDCQEQDIPLMLEPLSYPLDPAQKTLPSAEKRAVVIETARRLTSYGVDILKAEFPLDPKIDQNETIWADACQELNSASTVPWLLLSAAVDFETYLHQVVIACQMGASGIAVGRAVWKEAADLVGADRTKFLQEIARPRMARLNALCNALGHPWTEYFQPESVDENWYRH